MTSIRVIIIKLFTRWNIAQQNGTEANYVTTCNNASDPTRGQRGRCKMRSVLEPNWAKILHALD